MTRIVYYRCLLLFLLFFLWNINQSYGKNAVDLTKIAKELKDSKNTQSLKKTEKTAELILKNIDNIADENILNQTAEIFIKLNRFQDAEKLLKYSLSLNPLNKKTVKQLLDIEIKKKEYPKALDFYYNYSETLDLEDNSVIKSSLKQSILADALKEFNKFNFVDAERLFSYVNKLDKTDTIALTNLGKIYLGLGELEKAYIKLYIGFNLGDLDYQENLLFARCAYYTKNLADSLKALKKILKTKPDDLTAVKFSADIIIEIQKLDELLKFYDDYSHVINSDIELQKKLFKVFTENGHLLTALKLIENLKNLKNDELREIANIYYAVGQESTDSKVLEIVNKIKATQLENNQSRAFKLKIDTALFERIQSVYTDTITPEMLTDKFIGLFYFSNGELAKSIEHLENSDDSKTVADTISKIYASLGDYQKAKYWLDIYAESNLKGKSGSEQRKLYLQSAYFSQKLQQDTAELEKNLKLILSFADVELSELLQVIKFYKEINDIDKALAVYDKILNLKNIDKEQNIKYLLEAAKLAYANNHQKTEDYLLEILKKLSADSRENFEAQYLLAELYYNQKKFEKSEKYFENIRGRYGDINKINNYLIEIYRNYAISEYPENIESAANYFSKIIKIAPDDEHALFYLAKISYIKKEYPEALSYLKKISETSNYQREKMRLAADIEFFYGNVKDAFSKYDELIKNANIDNDTQIFFNYVECSEKLGKSDIAANYQKILYSKFKDNNIAKKLADYYLSISDDKNALIYLEILEKSFPTDKSIKMKLIDIYMAQGLYDKAEKNISAVLANDKDYMQGYLYLGEIYLNKGQQEKALQYFAQGLESGYSSDKLFKYAADLYYQRGLPQIAYKYYLKIYNDKIADTEFLLNFADACIDISKFEMAEKLLSNENLQKTNSKKYQELTNKYSLIKARFLFDNGKYAEALEYFLKLQEDTDVIYHKALCYFNNSDYNNAIAEFNKIRDYQNSRKLLGTAYYRLGNIIKTLENLTDSDSDSIKILFSLLDYLASDTDRIKIAKKYQDYFSDEISANFQLARIYERNNNLTQALEHYLKFYNRKISESPLKQIINTAYKIAEIYYKLEEYEKSAKFFEICANENYRLQDSLYFAGDCFARLKNLEKTEYYFSRLSDKKIVAKQLTEIYAKKLLNLYDNNQAAEIYKKLIELNPENYSYKYELAMILFYQQKYDEANELYEKVMMYYPDYKEISDFFLLSLLRSEKFEKLNGYLEKLESGKLNGRDLIFYASDYFFKTKNYGKALEYLNKAKMFAETAEIYKKLAEVNLHLAQINLALQYYERYLTLNKTEDLEIIEKLADLYLENGKIVEAYNYYSKIQLNLLKTRNIEKLKKFADICKELRKPEYYSLIEKIFELDNSQIQYVLELLDYHKKSADNQKRYLDILAKDDIIKNHNQILSDYFSKNEFLHKDTLKSYLQIARALGLENKYFEILEKSYLQNKTLENNYIIELTEYNFNAKKFSQTINILMNAVKQNSFKRSDELDKINYILAVSYFELKRFDDALRHLKLIKDTIKYDVKFYRAFAAYYLKDYTASLEMLAKLDANDSRVKNALIDIYSTIGDESFKAQRYNQALENYLRLSTLEQKSSLNKKIGDCYYYLKRYSNAVEYYSKADEQEFNSESEITKFAESLYNIEDYKKAYSYYLKLCEITKNADILKRSIKLAQQTRDTQNLEKLYLRLLEIEENENALYALYEIYLQNGNLSKALDFLKKYANINKNQTAILKIAELEENLGNYENAIARLEQLPDDVLNDKYKKIGRLFIKSKNINQALINFQRHLKKNSNDIEVIAQLGEIYFDNSDYINFIEQFNKLEKLGKLNLLKELNKKIFIAFYNAADLQNNIIQKIDYYERVFNVYSTDKTEIAKIENYKNILTNVSQILGNYYYNTATREKSYNFLFWHYKFTNNLDYADKLIILLSERNEYQRIIEVFEKLTNKNLANNLLKIIATAYLKTSYYQKCYETLKKTIFDEDVLLMYVECLNNLSIDETEKINLIGKLTNELLKTETTKKISRAVIEEAALKILKALNNSNDNIYIEYADRFINNNFEIADYERLVSAYFNTGNYAKSLKLLDSQKLKNDQKDKFILLKAKCLYRLGEYEKLAEMNIKASGSEPEIVNIINHTYTILAKKAYSDGKYDTALKYLNLLEAKDAELKKIEFQSLYNKGEYAEALKNFEKQGLVVDSNYINAVFNLYFKNGLIADAAKLSVNIADNFENLLIKYEISRIIGNKQNEYEILKKLLSIDNSKKYYTYKFLEAALELGRFDEVINSSKNLKFEVYDRDIEMRIRVLTGIAEVKKSNYFEGYKILAESRIKPYLSKDAYYYLAVASYESGKFQDAWQALTRIESEARNTEEIRKLKRNIYEKLGDLYSIANENIKAIENYRGALQYLENDTNIILKIASAYYSLKDYKNVIDIYTKLKREEIMDSFEYSRQLGWAYYYTGQEKEAAEYLANAALKSNDNNFILQIAQLSEKYLDTNKSIELYVLARNLVKNNDLNYKLAELFLKNNDLVNAANQYSIYLSTNPKNIEVLEKCADLYFQLSYVNDAIKLYNQLISLDKNKIKAYQRLGDLYLRLNDFKNAAANYEKYIMSNKSDNQAILTLARLLFKIEDYKKTIDTYKMLNFEILPADDKKTLGLAYFRLALATIDKKQAGYYFKEAFEIMKNEEYALEYIQQLSLKSAEYYFDVDLFDSAILSAKKYLQFNKTNFEIYYLLAKSFDNLKKIDSAVVYYYLCSLLDNTRNDVNKRLGLLLENKDPLLAAHYFEKYLQAINNNDAEIYLKTANLLFASKNYEKAYNYYSRLDLTKNKEYFDNIIECLIKLDNKSAAVEYILKKYKSDNKIKLEDLEYALKYYFENQNYVEIKRLVDTLPEIYKKQLTELNFIVGYTYWLSKELTNAAEYFLEFERKTADIKNFADYAYYLAEIYFSKNDLKKAGEYYEKFFKYHTNEKALNNRLSEKNIIDIRLKFVKILLELGDSKNIEQYIQQIIDKIELVEEKSKRDAYLIIGEYFLNNNNLNKAEEYFSLAKKSGANVIVPYTLLGLKYYEIKNFEKSQNFLNEAAGISDDPRVYQILGDIAISKNDTASAERNYLYLYSKAPSEENALILARLYRKSNNNIKAIEYYKFALNYNPKNSECLKYLGDAYFDLKNYELADRYLSVLFNLDQNKETILSKLAKSNFELGNFEKCAEYSGKLNNLRAEQMYEYGYSLYKIRKKIEALKIFDDLLQKGISANLKFQVLRLAADLYNELNSKIDARLIGYYEEMIKIHNDGTYKIEDANYFDKIVQQIAKFYFSITDYAKSYLYYSQIKKQSSLDNENYFNFAISAFHLKKYSEALQLFNSMSVKTKLPANNYKYTVVSYYYLNNFDNAYADLKKYFDAGLTAAPDIENFNKIAGKILYYKNDYNKAAEFLNRIYATNKNDTEILNLLGYIDLNNGKKTDALQKFENSLNINNNQWEILMTAGDLNYEINRFDNAARYYTKLQDLKTLDTSKSDIQKKLNDRILKLANIYYTKGLFRKSYEILSAYNQKYQNLEDFRIYYNSALAAMKVGKFDEADKLFEKSEKFNIKNSTYYQQYGLLSYKLKKYDRALLNVQKAVNLEPTNIDYMILLAEIYETGGNIKETVKIYERIYTLKNNDLKIINKLADLYYDSNNHQKAYELYLLSIKLDPTSDYASKAAQRLNELKKNLN